MMCMALIEVQGHFCKLLGIHTWESIVLVQAVHGLVRRETGPWTAAACQALRETAGRGLQKHPGEALNWRLGKNEPQGRWSGISEIHGEQPSEDSTEKGEEGFRQKWSRFRCEREFQVSRKQKWALQGYGWESKVENGFSWGWRSLKLWRASYPKLRSLKSIC